jgi:hypothetical protein
MGINGFIKFHKIYKYDKYDNNSNNIKNFLSQFDLFGVTYLPSLFHHYEQKTIYGALLTFILFIIIFSKMIIICFHIYSKDLYTLKTTTFNDNEVPTNINNFSISICTDTTFSVENNIKYNPFKQNSNVSNDTSNPIIQKNETDGECLFYDLYNLTLKDSDFPENLVYASTGLKILKNNTSSFFNIKFAIPLIYPSITDYYNPLQKRIKFIYFPDTLHGKILRIYLSKLQINYKNKFLFNIFHSEKLDNYTVFEKYELIDNLDLLANYGMNFIEIYYTGWRTQYSFVGHDLDSDICEFGGFVYLFYFTFNFIGRIINSIFIIQSINLNLSKKRSVDFSFKKKNVI